MMSSPLVLGNQPLSSSSSSSNYDGISVAQYSPDKEQEQDTVINPPNIQVATILTVVTIVTVVTVVTGPTVLTVQKTNRTNEEQQQEMVDNQPNTTVMTVPTPVSLIVVLTTKRTNSIAQDDWVGHRSIIFHVELEHGGDACGALQLSVVAYDPKDAKVVGEFNKCIKLPANAVWSYHASEVHGIYPTDDRIASAMGITEVWKEFVLFIEAILQTVRRRKSLLPGVVNPAIVSGCLESWKTRIMAYGILFMPRWCPYFMDPKKVVSHYSSCKLNQKHSGVIGYGYDEMWCCVTGNESLPGVHSAI
jgi:hypothetical protein